MEPTNKNKASCTLPETASLTDEHEWQQLCQQVRLACDAQGVRFVIFTDKPSATWEFSDAGWPLLASWTETDYQAVWQQAKFYCAIAGPNSAALSYLAVPITRGAIAGLLLVYSAPSPPSLCSAQQSLLDILAQHGALLWQAQTWLAPHALPDKPQQDCAQHLLKQLENVFAHAPIPITVFGEQGECTVWNNACEQLFGWSLAEVTQHAEPMSLLYPDADELHQVRTNMNRCTSSTFHEWQPCNKAGQRLNVLWAHIKLPDGATLGVGHDITQQREWINQKRLATNVFESSYDGIIISDPEHRITHINPAFTRITGFKASEVIDCYPYSFKYLLSNTELFRQLAEHLTVQDNWQGELNSYRKSGEECALLLAITVVKDDAGKVLNHVAVLSDITHLKQHEASLKHQAFHDALTGIPNRLLFGDMLERAIASSERNNRQLAVCYLDLDGFKEVNDNFGHAAGDQLLMEVSRRLSSSTRSCDAVARLGGDEFALLFTEFHSYATCDEILNRIQKIIRQPVQLDQGLVQISASIGVALYPQDADQAELLLRYADQAMYHAKKQGKDGYVYFDALADLQ